MKVHSFEMTKKLKRFSCFLYEFHSKAATIQAYTHNQTKLRFNPTATTTNQSPKTSGFNDVSLTQS